MTLLVAAVLSCMPMPQRNANANDANANANAPKKCKCQCPPKKYERALQVVQHTRKTHNPAGGVTSCQQ
jgi:hypothetical protein